MYGAGYKLEKWNKNPWFKPWFKINCVCHSIRSMFRVLGIYNFGYCIPVSSRFRAKMLLRPAAPTDMLELIDFQAWNSFLCLRQSYIHQVLQTLTLYSGTHIWMCVHKMLNHGLNHGFFLLLFKLISCPIHWIVCVLAYLNFIFEL